MSEETLHLGYQEWKQLAIKRGRQLRVCYDDKILLESRIEELEAAAVELISTGARGHGGVSVTLASFESLEALLPDSI